MEESAPSSLGRMANDENDALPRKTVPQHLHNATHTHHSPDPTATSSSHTSSEKSLGRPARMSIVKARTTGTIYHYPSSDQPSSVLDRAKLEEFHSSVMMLQQEEDVEARPSTIAEDAPPSSEEGGPRRHSSFTNFVHAAKKYWKSNLAGETSYVRKDSIKAHQAISIYPTLPKTERSLADRPSTNTTALQKFQQSHDQKMKAWKQISSSTNSATTTSQEQRRQRMMNESTGNINSSSRYYPSTTTSASMHHSTNSAGGGRKRTSIFSSSLRQQPQDRSRRPSTYVPKSSNNASFRSTSSSFRRSSNNARLQQHQQQPPPALIFPPRQQSELMDDDSEVGIFELFAQRRATKLVEAPTQTPPQQQTPTQKQKPHQQEETQQLQLSETWHDESEQSISMENSSHRPLMVDNSMQQSSLTQYSTTSLQQQIQQQSNHLPNLLGMEHSTSSQLLLPPKPVVQSHPETSVAHQTDMSPRGGSMEEKVSATQHNNTDFSRRGGGRQESMITLPTRNDNNHNQQPDNVRDFSRGGEMEETVMAMPTPKSQQQIPESKPQTDFSARGSNHNDKITSTKQDVASAQSDDEKQQPSQKHAATREDIVRIMEQTSWERDIGAAEYQAQQAKEDTTTTTSTTTAAKGNSNHSSTSSIPYPSQQCKEEVRADSSIQSEHAARQRQFVKSQTSESKQQELTERVSTAMGRASGASLISLEDLEDTNHDGAPRQRSLPICTVPTQAAPRQVAWTRSPSQTTVWTRTTPRRYRSAASEKEIRSTTSDDDVKPGAYQQAPGKASERNRAIRNSVISAHSMSAQMSFQRGDMKASVRSSIDSQNRDDIIGYDSGHASDSGQRGDGHKKRASLSSIISIEDEKEQQEASATDFYEPMPNYAEETKLSTTTAGRAPGANEVAAREKENDYDRKMAACIACSHDTDISTDEESEQRSFLGSSTPGQRLSRDAENYSGSSGNRSASRSPPRTGSRRGGRKPVRNVIQRFSVRSQMSNLTTEDDIYHGAPRTRDTDDEEEKEEIQAPETAAPDDLPLLLSMDQDYKQPSDSRSRSNSYYNGSNNTSPTNSPRRARSHDRVTNAGLRSNSASPTNQRHPWGSNRPPANNASLMVPNRAQNLPISQRRFSGYSNLGTSNDSAKICGTRASLKSVSEKSMEDSSDLSLTDLRQRVSNWTTSTGSTTASEAAKVSATRIARNMSLYMKAGALPVAARVVNCDDEEFEAKLREKLEFELRQELEIEMEDFRRQIALQMVGAAQPVTADVIAVQKRMSLIDDSHRMSMVDDSLTNNDLEDASEDMGDLRFAQIMELERREAAAVRSDMNRELGRMYVQMKSQQNMQDLSNVDEHGEQRESFYDEEAAVIERLTSAAGGDVHDDKATDLPSWKVLWMAVSSALIVGLLLGVVVAVAIYESS